MHSPDRTSIMLRDSVRIVAHHRISTFNDCILVQVSNSYLGSNFIILLALNEDFLPSEIS